VRIGTLVVGAGFTGAVLAEQIASRLGEDVLVVERRDHIGGNAYDYHDEAGLRVHRYGPHIFHTKSERVWNYLSRFTDWRSYEHRVLAEIDGIQVPVPFNFRSIDMLFAAETTRRLKATLVREYGRNNKVPILKLRQTSDSDLRKLADFIYEKVFYGYTLKQWGFSPEELGSSVTGRVPVVMGYDDRYFDDSYQAIPLPGYTHLFRKILAHPKIEVSLSTEFNDVRASVEYQRLVFTGPLDEYFNYKLGVLPYRSIRFSRLSYEQEQFQAVAQVNYPNQHEYTRITEFKHLTGQKCPKTSVAYEFPEPFEPRRNEPYYPIPKRETRDLYGSYAAMANSLPESVYFVGRLADYKYYNMDQATGRALTLADQIVVRTRSKKDH